MFLQHSKIPDSPEYLHIKIPPKYVQMGQKWHLKSLYLARTQARLTVGFCSIINLYLLAWNSKTLIVYTQRKQYPLSL